MRFALPRTTLAGRGRACMFIPRGKFSLRCCSSFGSSVLVAMADIIIDTVGSLIGATSASFPDDKEGRRALGHRVNVERSRKAPS